MPGHLPKTPLVSVSDFETAAEAELSRMACEYLQGGAADEITLRRNRFIFESLLLKPRVLRDVSRLDTSLKLFDIEIPHPLLLAPTGYTKLFHKEGELAVAEGAEMVKAIYTASSFATTSLEKIAAKTNYPLWFQLYTPPDRTISCDLLKRAEDSGYRAVVATIDTPT